jgi:hypothetical protein
LGILLKDLQVLLQWMGLAVQGLAAVLNLSRWVAQGEAQAAQLFLTQTEIFLLVELSPLPAATVLRRLRTFFQVPMVEVAEVGV